MTQTQTLHVGFGGIRVGDTILGVAPRTVVGMRLVSSGARRLVFCDGTTHDVVLGDELTIVREVRR